MIGWFANAIMAGWDHHGWKMDAELKPIPVSERLPGEGDCDADGGTLRLSIGFTPETMSPMGR